MPIRRTGEKLFLEIIQKTDNGTYRCIVQNDRNQLKTKHFAINVIGKVRPSFLRRQKLILLLNFSSTVE